jgi:hypothetical protein
MLIHSRISPSSQTLLSQHLQSLSIQIRIGQWIPGALPLSLRAIEHTLHAQGCIHPLGICAVPSPPFGSIPAIHAPRMVARTIWERSTAQGRYQIGIAFGM